MFMPRMLFQASIIFEGKAGAYPGAGLQGRLLALLANLESGWKDSPGTNALANFGPFVGDKEKSFIR